MRKIKFHFPVWKNVFLLFVFGFFGYSFSFSQTYNITIEITNIRNTKGQIQLQIYKDQPTFAKSSPWKNIHIPKSSQKENHIFYTIKDLPVGVYGIALLDDENSNKEMDYSFFLPKEGFGFANYYHEGWSRPKFDNFKFTLNSNKKMNIKVRYVN